MQYSNIKRNSTNKNSQCVCPVAKLIKINVKEFIFQNIWNNFAV